MAQQFEQQLNLDGYEIPEGVCDFDKENWDDIFQVSHYAMDIFNYLKSREVSNCIAVLNFHTRFYLEAVFQKCMDG